MAASQEQKVDFLLKKIGYVASKTGIAEDESSLTGTKKAPFGEAIPSPLVVPATNIWADSSLIPTTPPGSTGAIVRVYLAGTSGHRMTADSTISGNRTFIAYSTYNDSSTSILGNWISTPFGADYIVKVYKGDPNSGGVQLSSAGSGSDDTWFFDYSSGVLNFNGTSAPAGVTSSNIYIVGYRYVGGIGISPAAGFGTFSSLNVSGISTFAGLVDANGGVTANTLIVEDLTNDRVVLAGTGGELEDSANLTFDGSTLALTGNQTISGTIDVDGFLKITDRKKQMFKTSGGKYIAPQVIEIQLKQSLLIEQIMVIGEGKNMAAAIIQPNFDQSKLWLNEQGVSFDNNPEALSKNDHLIEKIYKEIRLHDHKFGKWEQVKVIRLTSNSWTVEDGHLTPTMKVKRKVVMDKYQDLINEIYE